MRISVMTRYASFFVSGDCPLKAHRVRGQNVGTKRFVWLTEGRSRHHSPSPCGKPSEATTPRRLRSLATVNRPLRSNSQFNYIMCFAGQSALAKNDPLKMTQMGGCRTATKEAAVKAKRSVS